MRDSPPTLIPHLQLSPDFQRSLCRQAQKQVPEGTMEIWAFRGKRRDRNSHLSVFYMLSALLTVMLAGWGCTETSVQVLILSLANSVVWASKYY